MEEKSTNWTQGTFNGYNERLLKVAENIAKLAGLTMQAKLAQIKEEVRREGRRVNHPVMDKFVEEIEKLEIK